MVFSKSLNAFSILFGIVLLQILSYYGIINSALLPSPYKILNAFFTLIQTKEIFQDTIISIFRVFSGFFLGASVGIFIASLSAYSKTVQQLIVPWIEISRPIPPLAWIPLAILWFGLGNNPAIFLVSLGSFFPVYTTTYHALISIPKKYFETARVMGADFELILFDIIIPYTLPKVVTGLRIGLGISWMIVITAELVGSTSGLGYFIQLNRIILTVENVIVGMLLIGVIGFFMSYLILLVENGFSHYQEHTV